jgi:hypothetical protein
MYCYGNNKINTASQFAFPAENFSISDPPLKFIYPDMTDGESSKGGIVEWGGVMDGASHAYGIATYTYQQNNSATFTAPSGYKKWGWITLHYDSPASTGESIHQHMNFETVKADWVTAITRFQISFGEDVALTSFPNTHVKVYNDLNFQIGTDAAGAFIKHDTNLARIVISGDTPWNFSGIGGMRIGSAGAPAGRLHVERDIDADVLVIRNTGSTTHTNALISMRSPTSTSRAYQTTVNGESFGRLTINIAGLIEWGSGSGSRDTNLYRSAANMLKTDDSLTAVGYLYQAGTFAGIHVHDASAAQSIPTGATYTKLTCYTDNEASSNVTPDATNDKITITRAGIYKVDGSFSFTCGTNNVTFFGALFLDGTEQDNVHWERKIGTAGDRGSASFTGIIDVTSANKDIDVRVRHDNAGSIDFTIYYSNLNIIYLGET